jgi:nitroimidazol reductase NimA-like FMN-containing flavoprotein (pyridoxamine 5'-phosphate oxidase superfamily)
MLTDTVRTLLQQPLTAYLSVVDANGFPHTVPVWFDVEGDDLVFISERTTRKVDYLKVNPKGAVAIGGDGTAGYLFKGTFTIEPDPDLKWMKAMTYRYEPKDEAEKYIEEWSALDMIVLRFKIVKISKVA